MLPTDLLMFRQNGEQIIPKRLNIDKFHLKLAVELIDCYKKAVGERYGELERRLAEMEGDNTDYKIKRGLAYILKSSFSTFEVVSPLWNLRCYVKGCSLVLQKLLLVAIPLSLL